MNIIQISPSYKPANIYGGTTVSIANLCEALASKCNLEVVTTTANGPMELKLKAKNPVNVEGVNVWYFNRITKDHTHLSPALFWHLLRKLIRKETNTIVHIHSWWNFAAIFSCLVAILTNTPVVLSPRGMLTKYTFSNRNSLIKLLIHYLIGKHLISNCHVHATSEQEKQDILEVSSPKSITVISNFVTQFKPITKNAFKPDTSLFRIIFLSRIEEKKGLELLLNSLEKCSFPWKLTIAGTGQNRYVKKIKNMAASLNITTHINWLGHVDTNYKFELIGSHDLLVLFSQNENFANVITESLACGTPVAVSKNVGLASYIQEYDLGWISSLDPSEIERLLHDAFQQKDKRMRIRKTAPKLIAAHFSKKEILSQYIKLYQDQL